MTSPTVAAFVLACGATAAPSPASVGRHGSAEITARGMHSRTWTQVTSTNLNHRTVATTNRYVEIGTGMHVFKNGRWAEANEEIVIRPDGGAAANQSQHSAYFPGDLYSEAFEPTTPLGSKMAMRPLGLAFADDERTTLIAELSLR